ncbi:hypothetical protein [Actinoplanes regularis]|uniref:Uncharacterized protein n=1 Tax=Actinoplanes regularis TaxID=52697 RepID=A0A239GSW1_9ACTN|nr:hypothetical protein [Actinoplanes regularis]GIE90864.1 hypothetical protein Are01nite_73440 [Actinoplanes regularis]SNS71942.1 hypothetical protein SAMN06264365_12244 [Actinoplanes regularis]
MFELGEDEAVVEPSSIELLIFPTSSGKRIGEPEPRSGPLLFGLSRMLRQEELERQGLDVEARPLRGYPLRFSSARSVRPEYHTVVLPAAGLDDDRAGTYGLGLMFPPNTVHALNSTSTEAAGTCELTPVDHVHIRIAEVPEDDPLGSARVTRILAGARPGQDNSGVVRELRAALGEPGGNGRSRSRASCVTEIHRAGTVVLGDDALTSLDPRFVLERTIIPAGVLLAGDDLLARRYVDLVAGGSDDPEALVVFLSDLVGVAASTTIENLLGYADGLLQQRASLLGLFGLVAAGNASSILVGAAPAA